VVRTPWNGLVEEALQDLSTPRVSAPVKKQFPGAALKMTVVKSMAQSE
jgi:hypothetical protein